MSKTGAEFFSWLHEANFYEELHREAVQLLPDGANKLWLDIGCGPGVLTRLAAQHGYQAVGIDIDAEMIVNAQQISSSRHLANCRFECGDFSDANLKNRGAAVISASSLLAVMSNKELAMETLMHSIKPRGTLLIIETTSKMNLKTALISFMMRRPRASELGLPIWGFVRNGRSPAIDFLRQRHFENCDVNSFPLLDGLVEAWVIRKHEVHLSSVA